jgi:two-component system sensor histidine kinase SenX3
MSPRRRDPAVEEASSSVAEFVLQVQSVSAERDRLADTLSASAEGVVVVDPDGREVFRNAAAERFRDARHSDAVAAGAIEALLTQALRGDASERDLQLFGPPRSLLHLRAVPLADGRGGAAVFVDDISEIKRIESVRRDFVANVSHELKTPIGALELLAETIATEADPAVTRPLAERMVKEAERLGRIVDDLLDLSLIETQEAPTRDLILVSALVDEAVDRLRPAAMIGGLQLEVHHGTDAVLLCDRRQVVSAISNLLDNAVKYTEKGGRIEVGTSSAVGRIAITVADSGIGVPGRDLERIFERFYRVDQARSRDTGGTGLGLAIVRHVAQAHGGEVSVTSVEGQGSTFTIVLPADDPSAVGFAQEIA